MSLRPRSRSPGGASIESNPFSVSQRPPFVHTNTDTASTWTSATSQPQIKITDFSAQVPPEAYPEASRPLLDVPKPDAKSPSLLRRLESMSSPRSPIARMLTRKRTNGEAYDRLGDEEADIGDMPINIDLSSLAGANIELKDVSQIKQPRLNILESVDEEDEEAKVVAKDHGLGEGMVIGAQLTVDTPLDRSPSNPQRGHQKGASVDLQRAKTIRQRGQQEAEKRQVIVAVQEAVDLSSYEGMETSESHTLGPESTYLTSRRPTELTQSYFYPNDPTRPNWKPFSMRPFYICLLILISITLAGVQEWLCQISLASARKNQAILSFDHVSDVSLWNFFCWKYLPTLIFVSYGVFWQIMDFDVRRLEPFYQLSLPNGSSAENSLNMDYLTVSGFYVPFKAIRYKQWAVFCSSMGVLLASSLSASLQNPSVVFLQNSNCTQTKCPSGQKRYFVRIQPIWSRFLSTSLLLTAVFGAILLWQLRRESGLLSDPKGIAGIASMATKSHILNDFQGLDTASERDIHKRLQNRRYVLYKSSIWQGEYIQHTQSIQEPQDDDNPHPIMMRRKIGLVFLGFLVFFLVMIPIMNFTPARAIPRSAPWLPVLVATFIKILWSTLDFDVRMMEPFYILSRGSAKPEDTLTLDYRGTPYGILPLTALINGHFLVAIVGFGSILADILTVTVSSFSVNGEDFLRQSDKTSSGEETFKSFWGSVSLSILIMIILICSAVLVYWRRGKVYLPRQPSTMSSILAFIFASKMLFDFVGTEEFNSRKMETLLHQKSKKYGLGWFMGFDKKVHLAIDEMPWKSKYDYGRPHDWVQAPWTSTTVDHF